MRKKSINYKAGYKYQLTSNYVCHVGIKPEKAIYSKYISLQPDGFLVISQGYCWDGPSGPTVDTPSFMRGSLIHDALYQLIREEKLSQDDRKQADIELKIACKEDGMGKIRIACTYFAVRKFAKFAADPKNKRKVITAP